ncbi:hypothetical protein ASF61_11560 [Duganella sp. Leaf126]|uniref:DUF3016 domain-containing protein n=1 Tax=Duganella sp. Leaf126 TaxID=1736266 RepID=UPI0006F464B0|nr:DUF3016 domain-containing protein [Duganella sp. Leaf126]KQQ33685.1 hypothetical protein ASF61_11560 [Duganella sp. Leaf126]
MHRSIRPAIAVLFGLAAGSAMATVTVTYVDPQKMTDVPRFEADRTAMEADFRSYLEELGKQLPAGQDLKVDILDIDLAGDVFPRVPVRDIRVTKGTYDFPRIHLRYRIEQDGKVLRSGERELADRNYQLNGDINRTELYGYEKRMLGEWFKKELLASR